MGSARRSGALWLALLIVVATALLWTQGVRGNGWTPDEEFFVQLARVLKEHFPGGLIDVGSVEDYDSRGIQRLVQVVLLVPLGIVDGETGFRLARALFALSWASAAVPAYLLARGAGLTVPWRLAAATLVIAVPWAVLGTSFLTEPLAYPLVAWSLWGAWRACLVPGVRSDLLALGLVALAVLARTGTILVIGVAPLAVALHAVAMHGFRDAVRRVPREHPLLALTLVGGAVVFVAAQISSGPIAGVMGQYTLDVFGLHISGSKFATETARMIAGVGVLPVLLGVPWVIGRLARPRAPELHALALTCALLAPLILIATLYSAPEERYLTAMVPALVLPGVVALARGELSWPGIAVMSVLVGVLLWRVPWPFADDAAVYQIDAARTFVTRVVLTRLPGDGTLALGLLLAALGIVIALLVRRGTGVRWLVVPILALALVQSSYVVDRRASATAPPVPLAQRTWVDDRVPPGTVVAEQAEGEANRREFLAIWREVEFFNRRATLRFSSEAATLFPAPRYGLLGGLKIDPRTGVITRGDGGPMPHVWLVPTTHRRLVTAGERTLATSTYLPLRLVEIAQPVRLQYRWERLTADGYLTEQGREARLRVAPAALEGGRGCAVVALTVPAGITAATHRAVLRSGGVRRRVAIPPGQVVRATIPVAADGLVRVTADELAPTFDGRKIRLQVASPVRFERCPAQ